MQMSCHKMLNHCAPLCMAVFCSKIGSNKTEITTATFFILSCNCQTFTFRYYYITYIYFLVFQTLMTDMERHVSRFEKFSNLANRLSQVCEPTTKKEIQRNQSETHQRWNNIFAELRTRTSKFKECLVQWLKYEEDYNGARTWLDAKEKLCEELLYGKEQRTRRDANLRNCQVCL